MISFERRMNCWTLLSGCLLLAVGCEKKPLPPSTVTSAAPSAAVSAAPSAPVTLVLDPAFLADRPDEYTAPRRVLARIQGNLERVAAGKEPLSVPKGVTADSLETFVSAYRAVLKGDAGAAEALAQVATLANKRLESKIAAIKAEYVRLNMVQDDDGIEKYAKLVSSVAKEPINNTEKLIIRLVATMRLVDAALLMESGDDKFDLFERNGEMVASWMDHSRDAAWIRLPCQTVLTHRVSLEAAGKVLGKAAGSILSCPVPEKLPRDYDFVELERRAKSPAEWASAIVVRPVEPPKKLPSAAPVPPTPWKWKQAIEYMNEDPDAAEKLLAEAAEKNVVGKLDYALFLQAFRPASKTRDEKIKKLVAEIDKASIAAAKKADDEFLVKDESIGRRDYDGTDESLIGSIRLASSTGAANTESAFYAIPCAILMARPKLLAATAPLFGGNRDNFLPRSGCSWDRGFVKGFPDMELEAWRGESTEADGKFMLNQSGSMQYGWYSAMNLEEETLRTNPLELLKKDPPKMLWPYETWSYMTPESRTIYKKLLVTAETLKSKLVAHYKTRGIAEADAERIARTGLFQVVFGANCGNIAPGRTLRKLVVDGASADEIRAFVAAKEHEDETRLEPFRECAKKTGTDPLIHMAVLQPDLLPVLWELFPKPSAQTKQLDLELDPNTPNRFGKTPLMVAAQQNQIKAAKLLLDQGAAVERSTFKKTPTGELFSFEFGHDARTALMYAAARGSLDMMRLLLDRGADKYAADTKGRRALHYLLGLGPVGANSKLSATEMGEAIKLLY